MRKISFENFLVELRSISIDHLNMVITDRNKNIIVTNNIANLHGQTKSLEDLQKVIGFYKQDFKLNEIYTLTVGEMSYIFYGQKFLHNIGDITIAELKNIIKQNFLDIGQILYLLVNMERVQF